MIIEGFSRLKVIPITKFIVDPKLEHLDDGQLFAIRGHLDSKQEGLKLDLNFNFFKT